MFKISFNGRIGRWNFFIGLLVSVVVLLVFRSLVDDFSGVFAIVFGIVTMVAATVFVVFALSLYVRRLHDVGWSGWLALLTLVPVVNLVLFLILLFMPGKKIDDIHDQGMAGNINHAPSSPVAPVDAMTNQVQ